MAACSSASSADRNLLFGILALQMDFISRDQLVAGMNAWVLDKSQPLAAMLVAQQAIASDTRDLIDALVAKHLQQHDNDLHKSLASINSVGSVQAVLQDFTDPDLQATLVGRTASLPVNGSQAATLGTSTSTGRRFQILRPHARGGLGQVYVALDKELNREVALKEIQERHADNLDSRGRFVLEAQITGGLEHPGVVPVYGLGTYDDGRPFYAMRFIKGDSLKEAIERFHKTSSTDATDSIPRSRRIAGIDFSGSEFRQLLRRFVDVCNALQYAHHRGVLHRDLKPANIILGKYGETLVVDWGLAKVVGTKHAADGSEQVRREEITLRPVSASGSVETLAGSAMGTPAYMSPEQAMGQLDLLGPASDIYGLGATLYCLLTGRPPFEGAEVGLMLAHVQLGEFKPPRQVDKHIPLALDRICRKAMALKPEERYVAALELAADVEHWLADEPVSAYRESILERTMRRCRQRPLTSIGVSFLAALDLAVLGTIIGALGWQGIFLMVPFMLLGGLFAFFIYIAIWAQITAFVGALIGVIIASIVSAVRGGIKKKTHRGIMIGGKVGATLGVVVWAAATCVLMFALAIRPDPSFGVNSTFAWIACAAAGLTPILGAIWAGVRRTYSKTRLARSVRGALIGSVLGSFVAFTLLLVAFVTSLQEQTDKVHAAALAQRSATSPANGQAPAPAGGGFLLTMIATQEKLASQDPTNAVPATSLATFYHLHANSVRDQGKAQDALVWYGKAVSTLEPFLKKEPRLVQVREALKKNHSDRAEALTRLARHAEALSDRERALELDTWPDHSELRLQRALALARLGQHAKATAEADALASAKELKGETLYTLARVYALSVAALHRDGQKGLPPPQAEREQQLERRGAAAVKLLAEAEAAGHFKTPANLQDLRDHEDFNSLRARADFKTLLNGIQANVKTNTK